MADLDLERGDPAAGERPRRRRRTTTGNSNPPEDAPQRDDSEIAGRIKSQLDELFDRIVKARRAREDEELAEVVEEDAEAMTQGFMSLTNNVPFLRQPLIMLLNILLPVLAFNRVARILFIRFLERRAKRQEAQAQAQAEWEAEQAINGQTVAQ